MFVPAVGKDLPAMLLLSKVVHVLALGLWCGTCLFFTFVVGLTLFSVFGTLAEQEARPLWLPLPPEYQKPRPSERFPDPLRKEQGSRVAGAAVGALFPWYYGIQAVCGVLAVLTAVLWVDVPPAGANRVRFFLLAAALITVGAGWWLERVVHDKGVAREQTSEAVLRSAQPSDQEVQAADQARADFGRWHFYSLLANFATVGLVTVAMGLAAALPGRTAVPEAARSALPAHLR
jgi:hypothetical protein